MSMILGKDTGNVMSWVMGTGGQPVVGEGATIIHWTDRSAYTVIEVSEDGKSCTIQRDKAIRNFEGMTDAQDYTYERDENGAKKNLVFKWKAWREDHSKTPYQEKYPKVNLQFGRRDEYYDYSF